MPNNPSSLSVQLFYSYSHKDIQHKKNMETTLATLKQQGLLQDWSDTQIMPGQSISEAIHTKLSESNIIAFLLSSDFLASEECRKEWRFAKKLADSGRLVYRVPIILRDCPWQDFLANDDVKALPVDGQAITTYQDRDSAWQEVYEGIKSVIDSLRTTYTAKPAFLADLSSTDLPLSKPVSLEDIFVFPHLTTQEYTTTAGRISENDISSVDDLLDQGHSVIHGQDKSGKTALAKHICRSLVNDGQPVLYADLGAATNPVGDKFLRTLYEDQFNGDYNLWQQQENKSLIIDNMAEAPKHLKFVEECLKIFSHIYLFVSSDVYHSFLRDENRLADFQVINLKSLTHTQQEQLIRKRLSTLDRADELTDGFVDQVEDRVNSVIISNKIVPRYPFFVLAILQTYDALMPKTLSITSYGHCYHVFILASIFRAGISEADDSVNSSFNFAEQLALATFLAKKEDNGKRLDFSAFQSKYRSGYLIQTSLINRLTHERDGIITGDGDFKTAYMYYYFLGKLFAANSELAEKYLPELCEHSYDEGNYLTLLFTIHHATDDKIIEDILVRTMVELEDTEIATLSKEETSRFSNLVSELPESVLSGDSVETERMKERRMRDNLEERRNSKSEEQQGKEAEQGEKAEPDAISILRVLKNNKILGQVLRNQYGKLHKNRIEEIVEIIADSSFRLINTLLKNEDEIQNLASYIHTKCPEADLREIQQWLRRLSFVWTVFSVEQAVNAVNVPSIHKTVDTVVTRNDTPAYKIFGYFYQLDSGETLTDNKRKKLANLYKDYQKDDFIKRVLSLRTQAYMKTHHSKPNIEQSICSILGIRYIPRRKPTRASIR